MKPGGFFVPDSIQPQNFPPPNALHSHACLSRRPAGRLHLRRTVSHQRAQPSTTPHDSVRVAGADLAEFEKRTAENLSKTVRRNLEGKGASAKVSNVESERWRRDFQRRTLFQAGSCLVRPTWPLLPSREGTARRRVKAVRRVRKQEDRRARPPPTTTGLFNGKVPLVKSVQGPGSPKVSPCRCRFATLCSIQTAPIQVVLWRQQPLGVAPCRHQSLGVGPKKHGVARND